MFTEKTYINPKIEIKNSSISGKGMFAKEDILKHEVIIKWGGEFLTTKEAKKKESQGFLIIQIDDDLWSVEKYGEFEEDYFINHSCDSNCWMVDGKTFTARNNINKGEEITVDYSLFESEDYISQWECKCGLDNCRKKITGKDCLISDVQKQYRFHFSPVVQKRIEKS